MITPILPEYLYVFFTKKEFTFNIRMISHMFHIRNKRPEYKELLSRIKCSYNGVFYYSECMREASCNLVFSSIIVWDQLNDKYAPSLHFDHYYDTVIKELNDDTFALLDELVEEVFYSCRTKDTEYKATVLPMDQLRYVMTREGFNAGFIVDSFKICPFTLNLKEISLKEDDVHPGYFRDNKGDLWHKSRFIPKSFKEVSKCLNI